MTLADKLKQLAPNGKEPETSLPSRGQSQVSGPIWAGPCAEGEQGGITFSLLSRFLCDRERFRLYVVEGLRSGEGFNHRLEYGNLWHWAEEAYAATLKDPTVSGRWKESVEFALSQYAQILANRYPLQRELVEHWYTICKMQFPIYIDYWSKKKDKDDRTSIMQEKVFDVRYQLPSGQLVRLRGKWDDVSILGKGSSAIIFLHENKTKGDIDERLIKRQLTFDLQTMLYLTALSEEQDNSFWRRANKAWRNIPIGGVIYNIVRRPLSGGKGTIVRKKATKNKTAESKSEFYARLASYIKQEPESYFMRWRVEVSRQDILNFKQQCLNPVLQQLCDWWAWINSGKDIYGVKDGICGTHWRMPYGVYNPLLEGDPTEVDEYLATGSTLGLSRATNLFPELQD